MQIVAAHFALYWMEVIGWEAQSHAARGKGDRTGVSTVSKGTL